MKTVFSIILSALLFLPFSDALAQNFLKVRVEHVIPEDDEIEEYVATYTYYSRYLGPWDVGVEFLTGDDEFYDLSIHSRYKAFSNLYVGAKLSINNTEKIRPTFTAIFHEDLNRILPVLDKDRNYISAAFTQELFSDDPLSDFWASYSHCYKKFRISAEVGYYFNGDNPEHFYVRPLRLEYPISKNIRPFVMYQRSWINEDNWRTESNSFLAGFNVIW